MGTKWDVVGVGSNSVDFVYRVPAYPQAQGENAKMRIVSHDIFTGGQTATALCTCAALGLRATYLGTIGSDDKGERMRGALAQRGVDLSHAITRDCGSHYAVILVGDQTGERIVLWDHDERLTLKAEEITAALISSARVVHVDDVDQDAAIRAATLAREAGVVVTSDIDRLTPKTEELAATVTIPIFAEHVPPALTGETDMERALRKLQRRSTDMLCATLGEEGAIALAGNRIYREPAFRIKVADSTGAGDVFRGAFIQALLRGESPPEMLRFANAAAAISCTRVGAMNGVPTRDEIAKLMQAV
jgi:sulfofructose kinase